MGSICCTVMAMMHLLSSSPSSIIAESSRRQQQAPHPQKKNRVVQPSPLNVSYNRPGFEMFHYNVYAVCGDGCLMEGIASEAVSLAGHLGLDNLCWIYDNNHITIEGHTRLTFTEDVAARFLAYGWNVVRVGDANDLARIEH